MTKLTSKCTYTLNIGNHPHTNMPPQSEILRRGEYTCRTLEMHLQLRGQQFKTISCVYIYIYIYRDSYIKASGQLQSKNLHLIHMQIRKINSHKTIKIVIKPKERTREEGKKNEQQKQIQNS